MELTEQHILIDTNILLTTLRDEDYFLEPQRELLMTHLHDLHEENTFYMTDIIKYEYIKNAKKYLLKKKKMREKIQKRVDKVILCYENKEKILKNDVENLEENMLDLDEQLGYEDIKYTDKLILLSGISYFSNTKKNKSFWMLTADRSDFLNKMPKKYIEAVHHFSLLRKNYKTRTYFLIKFTF